MRVLLVSGIFPPDIGGPATHVADLRRELLERGHEVELIAPTDEPTWSHSEGMVRLPAPLALAGPQCVGDGLDRARGAVGPTWSTPPGSGPPRSRALGWGGPPSC